MAFNLGAWLGSTSATVGQKTMSNSIPVVIASDQPGNPAAITDWLGSTAPTVGQKTMAASLPVVIASDQTSLPTTEARLPTALVSGRLDANIGAWHGSTSATVGQKTMASSIPVTMASDQPGSPTSISDWIGSTAPTVGQKTMVASLPVVLASDQSSVPTTEARLPTALVGGRLDSNVGAWLGSTAPTVAQKTMANSVPVVIASDQSSVGTTEARLPTALVSGRLDCNVGAWLGSTGPTVGQKTMANSIPVVQASDAFPWNIAVASWADKRNNITLTTTASTTLLAATASRFLNVYALVVCNTGTNAQRLDVSDGTRTISVPLAANGGGAVICPGFPIKANTINTAWTAQCSATPAGGDVRVFAAAVETL